MTDPIEELQATAKRLEDAKAAIETLERLLPMIEAFCVKCEPEINGLGYLVNWESLKAVKAIFVKP